MKISLDALQLIDAIDLKGSFAAAAASVHRVPSAVTHAVRKLEEDLGLELFQREGRRAVLTPAGRILLEEGRHLLRAASMLENRVQRVSHGWETELRIAVDAVVDIADLMPLIAEFDRQESGTRLRFSHEVLGGGWDALITGRADLAVGVKDDPPPGSGLVVQPWGETEFVLAVAPHHPLATVPDPLSPEVLARHRVVAIADTSLELAARDVGLPTSQSTLTFPTMAAKAAAQIAGLGIGHLPRVLAEKEVAAGRLVIKREEGPMPTSPVRLAWRSGPSGKALDWFRKKLNEAEWKARLLPGAGKD
ncbi:LysR family transcriptional regulator [Denitratisoma sp. agr-D3]